MLIKKLINATPILFFKEGIYTLNSMRGLEYIVLNNQEAHHFIKADYGVFFKDILYISPANLDFLSYDLATNQKELIFENFAMCLDCVIDNSVLIRNGNGSILRRYNLKTKTIEWEKNSTVYLSKYIDNQLFIFSIGHGSHKIQAINSQDGTFLWERDFTEIGRRVYRGTEREGFFSKVLGMVNNELICVISDQYVMALDPYTGATNWQITYPHENWNGETIDDIPLAKNLQLNQDQTKLYALKVWTFVEVDLIAKSVSRVLNLEQMFSEIPEKRFSIYGSDLAMKHMIFSASYTGRTWVSGLIGSFNIETAQLDWLQELEFSAGEFISQAPQVVEDKIYLGTSESSLYIFDYSQYSQI